MGRRVVAGLALLLAGCAAHATSFPAAPTPKTAFHSLYRPDGPGPFPAVVLLHTCAGLRPHVLGWAAGPST
jgi:dienelactone hydrolase